MWQTILHTVRTGIPTRAIILNNVTVNFRPGEYMRMIFSVRGRWQRVFLTTPKLVYLKFEVLKTLVMWREAKRMNSPRWIFQEQHTHVMFTYKQSKVKHYMCKLAYQKCGWWECANTFLAASVCFDAKNLQAKQFQ